MALLHCGNLTLEGKSSSAVATYIRVKELDLVFDLGRCPMSFIGVGNVFISHFHLDHYWGLPIYISHRLLSGIPPGNIYVPSRRSKQFMQIVDMISALDMGGSWAYQINLVEAGEAIRFRQNLIAHILPGDHRVPSVSYLICEIRKKLKPEFQHLSGRDIAALKHSGVEITSEVQLPLIAYLGDTRSIPIDAHPLLKQCKVLICECTFILPEHRSRAKKTMHLHLEMLPPLLAEIESEHIVLMHFSRRYTPELIRQTVYNYLPPQERSRVQLFL